MTCFFQHFDDEGIYLTRQRPAPSNRFFLADKLIFCVKAVAAIRLR